MYIFVPISCVLGLWEIPHFQLHLPVIFCDLQRAFFGRWPANTGKRPLPLKVAPLTACDPLLTLGSLFQITFAMYPTHRDAELIMLSGRTDGSGITSLGAHWGAVYKGQAHGTSSNSTALA